MILVWVDRKNSVQEHAEIYIFVELLYLKIIHIKKCEVTFGLKYIWMEKITSTQIILLIFIFLIFIAMDVGRGT